MTRLGAWGLALAWMAAGCEESTAPAVDAAVVVVDAAASVVDARPAQAACAPFVVGGAPAIDPTLLCAADCVSTEAASDVTVHLEAVTERHNLFSVHVVQTRPSAVDLTFTMATAGWSGHFYFLSDMTSLAPEKMSVLVGTAESPANVHVYLDDLATGSVSAGIGCEARGYPPGGAD